MGTMAIWRTRRWTRTQIGQALILASLFGLLSGLAFAFDPQFAQERHFLRVGLRYLITGLAALGMGVAIARVWPRGRLGQQLTAVALTLYGFDQLHVFSSYALMASGGTNWPWAKFTNVFSLITQLFIGYGLVIWLLENERDRAESATDAAERLRLFDQLTGLPNRSQMLSHLGQQMQHPNGAALLLVRLDNLGNIAVATGMDGVDIALATSAERIEEVARANGLVAARPGADHIALHGAGVGNEAVSQRIAEKVLAALALPVFWNGREIALEASVGIALAPQDAGHRRGPAVLRRDGARARPGRRRHALSVLCAGPRCRRAQPTGPAVRIADGFRQQRIRARIPADPGWLEPRDLRLRGAGPLAASAARVARPGCLHRPARTAWAWSRRSTPGYSNRPALRACSWQRPDREPLTVAVNVSAYSFQRRSFPDMIHSLLDRTGLAAACLEIEIIESIALGHPEHAALSIDRLRDLGVRVMLDDFGTGFSSLKHLRQLPFDGLKIDHSFVVDVLIDPRDAAIVRAMLSLAHSLGLEVVAEGIETAAQLAWFQSAGCDRLQGFHFHRSMTQEAVIDLLRLKEPSGTAQQLPVS